MRIYPIILSGGSGSRLWPLSRKEFPKQYLSLVDEKQTLLQATLKRIQGVENLAPPTIICNTEHRFLVAEQLQQIGIHNATIMLELVGKNTAPAIAAAARHIVNKQSHAEETPQQSSLLILSADHEIKDVKAFHKAIQIASKQVETGKLVTFGIVPISSHTGYGYIEKGPEVSGQTLENMSEAYKIKQFIEKPDQLTANRLLQTDNFLWNSGMFLFQIDQLLEQLTRYAPEITQAAEQAVQNATEDYDFTRLEPYSPSLVPLSIDYALMEKTNNAVVVALDAGWSDVGSWSALYEIGEKDQNNNHIKGDAIVEDTTGCYIHADHHMIATIGVENLIIVDTPDATLVTVQEKAEQVKYIVEQLQQQGRCEQQTHRKVFRPWGWYDTVEKEDRFKVKRICVNPGSSLSLQKHYHRAEHWIVVSGTAKITNGGKTELLSENQSTYIPVGVLHRLENPGNLPLEMIEVQSGSYLGEDDIERYEDYYGRVS
jgi:mannose-1-phosphate guanylyltransferase/mannose-6-phosphate isomerase